MKDLFYYDHRHGNTVIVRGAKSRKSALKVILINYVPNWFHPSTIKSIADLDEVLTETKVIDLE